MMGHWKPEPPELLGKLSAYHFPGTHVEIVIADLGSDYLHVEAACHYRRAFWCREGNWIVVYSEHSGYHAFAWAEDLDVQGQEGPNTENERAESELMAEILNQKETE